MKCEVTGCGRDGLSQKEKDIHMKYYHGVMLQEKEQPQKISSGACPECGSAMFYQEGCSNCQSCGFSKCG